jgi:purine-binding chemotaxis protein CheW
MSATSDSQPSPSIELATSQRVEPVWFGEQHIIVTLAGSPYAVPLLVMQEVENPPATVPVPFAPDWVAGVVNLRGTIVTLVDLPVLLGVGTWERGPAARILVLRGDGQVAVAVDGLQGMRRLPEHERVHIDAELPGRVAHYLSGACRDEHQLIGILDLPRLLADTESEHLSIAPLQPSDEPVAERAIAGLAAS